MARIKHFDGGCLCGAIRYRASAEPVFPHLCSCTVCRRWSGAPTVAWVEFPWMAFAWTGNGTEPTYFQSSAKTRRGHCGRCGSALCAVDEGYENISIVIASLDRPNVIVPDVQHSYRSFRPTWWHPTVAKAGGRPEK